MTSISTELFDIEILAQEGRKVPVWIARPLQLVSLLEMLHFYGLYFYLIGDSLRHGLSLFPRLGKSEDSLIPDDLRQTLIANLKVILNRCKEIGLTLSAMSIEETLSLAPEDFTYRRCLENYGDIQRRIRDELQSILFLHVPQDKVGYYENKPQFGEQVADKFPKAITDIQEAGKCFATARYTACVFHLMRVMEIGVQQLGNTLGVPDPEEKEWQKILNDVNGAIKRLGNPSTPITPAQKERRDEYAQAAVYLENVKNAWRNNVMHPKDTYTEEEAAEVFRTTKVYMKYLEKIL